MLHKLSYILLILYYRTVNGDKQMAVRHTLQDRGKQLPEIEK